MVDALGNPVGFLLTGGQAHDLAGADHLLPGMKADLRWSDISGMKFSNYKLLSAANLFA
jgi:hypothetical protein